jgi:PKD repeat protein
VLPVNGPVQACAGNAAVYTVPISGATVYTWTVDQFGTIVSGQGGHQVEVLWDGNAAGTSNIHVSFENELAGCEGVGDLAVQVLQRFHVNGGNTIACENDTLAAPFHSVEILSSASVLCNWSVTTPTGTVFNNVQLNSSSFHYGFFAGAGQYTITAFPVNGGYCNGSASAVVQVAATPPAPAPIVGDVLVCPSTSHHYSTASTGYALDWSILGGTITQMSGNGVNVTWDANGPYELAVSHLSAGNPNCISQPTLLSISAFPAVSAPQISGPSTLCLGENGSYFIPLPLLQNAIYSWSIDPPQLGTIVGATSGNAISVNWIENNNVAFNANILLTIGRCGDTTLQFPVLLDAQPNPSILGPATTCTGTNVTFNVGVPNLGSYFWNFGDGDTLTTNGAANHSFTSAGTYPVTLEVTNGSGCVGSTSFNIVVNGIPALPIISGNADVCALGASNYSFAPSLGGVSYAWSLSPAIGSIVSTGTNSIAVTWNGVTTTTVANVELQVSSQCLSTTVSYPVSVHSLPNPIFTGPSSICSGETAAFTDNATSGTVFWNFGDGSVATVRNPSHTFANPGSYTVTLTVTDLQNCTAITTANIVVHPNPNPVIAGPITSCAGTNATYIGSGAQNILWNFGDGGNANTSTATHNFTIAGNYVVTLYATDGNGCSASTSQPIAVNPVPTVPTLSGFNSVCAGTSTSYSFTPISPDLSYSWTVNPPNVSNSSPSLNAPLGTFAWNPVSIPTSAAVELNVASTCLTTTVTYPIVVHPVPTPVIGGPTEICVGSPAAFTDNFPGQSVAWDFGDGGTSSNHNPVHSYTSAGTYTVTLATTNLAGCIATSTFQVFVHPIPVLPVVTGPDTACARSTTTYSYSPSNLGATYTWTVSPPLAASLINGANSPTLHVLWNFQQVTTTAEVILTMTSDCDSAVIQYPVTINPLPAAGTIAATILCEGQSAQIGLAPISGSSYSWAPSLGLSSSNVSNPSASPSTTTVYNVTETILATGCARTNAATVVVNPNPAANPGLDVSMCQGNLSTIGAAQVPGNTYAWSPNASLNNSNSSNPIANPTVTTTYTLVETITATQCSTSNTVTVTVNPTPSPILGYSTPICLGQISQLSVSGGNVWAWQFGDGSSSNLQNPMHAFDSIGTQTIAVTVTDSQGCAANTSALINVNPVPEAEIVVSGLTSYCIGDTIATLLQQNLSGNSYVFSWQPGNFSGNPLAVQSTGNYSLVIENEFSCSDTSNTIEITQGPCQCPCGGIFPVCDPCPCPCGGIFPNCDACTSCNPLAYTLGYDTAFTSCATVTFSEFSSSNVTHLSWNFGDGTTTTNANPTHSFTSPGVYPVKLSGIAPGIQSPGGDTCSVVVDFSTVVTIPLIANFFTQFECNGNNQIATQFFDNSLFYVGHTIDQWEWDFGDGSPHSFSASPTHVYATSGTYYPTLTIQSGLTGAICSATLPVQVPAPSTANFVNPSPVCQGVPVSFLNSSTGQINSHTWDFDLGDVGSPTSNVVNPSYTYGVSGPINVQLTVMDVYGCESTVSQAITVLASANGNIASNSLAFCTGDSALLLAPPGLSWLWSPGGQTTQSLTISSPGNYEVLVSLANGCSYQTASVYVSENPLPTANVGTNGVVCLGESVQLGTAGIAGHSYVWTPSTGLSDPQIGDPLAEPSASTIYTLTETINATGCSVTQTLPITVNPIPAAITGENDTICNGESVQLGAPHILGHTYQWSPSLGLNSATFADPNASPTQTTFYHLTESITASGCTMENDVVVVVNPLPLANVGNPNAVCLGGSVVLGGSAIVGRTYQWSPSLGLSSEFVSNPLATPNGTTSYTLVETIDATGCVDSITVIATVNPLPEANPGENATICLGESLTLGVAAVSGNSYAWFPTTHLTNATISNPVTTPPISTTYTLTETVLATGCSRAQNIVVTVNPQPIGNAGTATSICAGDSTSIGTVPIVGNTYTWLPATGLSNSNLANPQASPSTTTTYILHETNTATGCEKFSSVTVTVNPLPLINAGSNVSICAGSNTTLGSSSLLGNSYSWSPSTALNSAVVANPTASPSATTTYQLVQTVNATGCQATENVTITVNPRPAAVAGSNVAICLGGSTNLGIAAVNGNTYAWNPSLGLNDPNISNPVANPTVTSTYSLTETILSTGCENTETILLTVNPLPPANVGNDVDICAGETAMLGGPNTSGNSYLWSPGTGLSAANVSNPIVSPNSSTTYSLTETNVATGCSQTQSVNVTVHANPDAFVGNPTTICAGDTIQLGDAAVPGNSYIWATSLGLSDANLADPLAFPASTTVYSLTETNLSNGCTTSNIVEVTVNPQPNANVIGDQVYCVGDSIVLSTTLGYDYEWEFDDFPIDGNFQSIGETDAAIMLAANLGNAGNYAVLVTDQQNGCSIRSLPHPVLVNEQPDQPEIEANGTGVLCNDQTWTLSVIDALPGINYSWSTGQIGTSIVAANAQTYWVVATNGLGCSTASEVIDVLPSPTISGLPTGCYEHCATLAPLEIFGPLGFASYEWFQEPNHSLISTNPDISIDSSGSYRLRVTNVEGCFALSEFIQITFIDCCTTLAAISSTVDVTCFGNNDGAATVVASGGLPPYHYQWDSGDTTATIQNLWAGIYLIDVIDQNNCLFHLEDTVYEPTELILTQVENEILCYGDSAFVSISATGGTLPYSGTGSYPFAAGPYTITVIDAQGCAAMIEGELNQPEPLFMNVSTGTIQCQGDSTNVLVNVSGGVAPYVGTGTFVVSNGMHIYHVSDENGCTVTDSVAIAPISTLEAVAQVGTIACRGGSTTIGVTAIGGLPPYLGLITDTVFAGTYLYEVEDANGCTDTIVVEVTEPDAIGINVAAEEILCHGDTVNVMVTASGGTGAFLGTGTFSVSAGLHSFTVTDANNCASTSNITLIEPTSLTGLATFDPLLCHGDSTTVNIIAIGGTPPYQGIGAFTTAAGIHQYLLQDANLCQFSLTVNIASPTPIVAQATAEPLSCGGSSTTVTVSAIGGTEPYFGIGTFIAVAGTHQYVVTDANGCFTTVILTIAAPTANIALSAINTNYGCHHNISCYGGCDGGIDLSVSGGLPPYTYLWSNQAATQDLQGLCSGEYSVTVTDVQGCTTIESFMLTQPSPLILNLTSPTDACGYHVSTCCATGNGGSGSGSDHGSAQDGHNQGSGSGSGSEGSGSGHRNHSFGHGSGSGSGSEGSGSGSNSNINCGQSTSIGNNGSHGSGSNGSGSSNEGSGGNGSTHRGTQSIAASNLSAMNGHFGHDGSNASGNGSGGSDHENRPPCGRDGAVNLSVVGGCLPYSYHWSASNVGNTNHPVGLSAGLHFVTVTDGNGCTAIGSITLTQASLLSLTASSQNISCFGLQNGSATATVNGGCGPYTYLWCNGSTSSTISGLGIGTYSVTVTDGYGCHAETTVSIAQPSRLVVDAGLNTNVYPAYAPRSCTTLHGNVHGGTAAYTISWISGNGNVIGLGLNATICPTVRSVYRLRVTDAQGCIAWDSVAVCPISVSCGSNMVRICHNAPGHHGASQNQCVPASTVASHLAHGDRLGTCGASANCAFPSYHNGSGGSGSGHKSGDQPESSDGNNFQLQAYPNPTVGKLDVLLTCNSCDANGLYHLRLTDLAGKVLLNQPFAMNRGLGATQLNLTHLASGTYLLSVDGFGFNKIVQRVVKD